MIRRMRGLILLLSKTQPYAISAQLGFIVYQVTLTVAALGVGISVIAFLSINKRLDRPLSCKFGGYRDLKVGPGNSCQARWILAPC